MRGDWTVEGCGAGASVREDSLKWENGGGARFGKSGLQKVVLISFSDGPKFVVEETSLPVEVCPVLKEGLVVVRLPGIKYATPEVLQKIADKRAPREAEYYNVYGGHLVLPPNLPDLDKKERVRWNRAQRRQGKTPYVAIQYYMEKK
jgi:hypothetical protein